MTVPSPTEQRRSPTAVARSLEELLGDGEAATIHSGRRTPLSAERATIGRETDNDIVVDSELASRHHACIARRDGRWYVADLQSTNGTFLNGERLVGEARWLQSGDSIAIGGESLRFVVDESHTTHEPGLLARIPLTGRLTIGRSADSDVRLEGPTISGLHAQIVTAGDRIEVVDRGSRSGTRVDGELVQRAEIVPGSEIGVGAYRFVFDGTALIPRDDTGALRLEADALTVDRGGKRLLDRVALAIEPGELVAIVGESGAGKSTLLKVLAGVARPTAGSVLLSGDPVDVRLADVGYLPQDEIVHPRLTVRESLRYAARLRLPDDSSDDELVGAVERAIASVALGHVADERIGDLSGGQRKRVGLATELLSHPGILFLDEPTTGLDVGLERQMMQLFRSLAAVGEHAVVVVTHATHSLDQVDRLCVMGRGGHLCFSGSPADALAFFAVTSYADIYLALQQRPASEWREQFEQRRPAPAAAVAGPARGRIRAGSFSLPTLLRQTAALTSRYLTVFLRDRLNLAILLAQAPLLGLMLLLLFRANVLGGPGTGTPLVATQLVFLLVMITIWLGAVDASREIVKERAILARERAMGVRIASYLVSKAVVLFSLIVVQAVVLLGLAAALRPFHEPFTTYLDVFGILCLAGFAAVAMGLLISCVAQNEDQATALAPVAMTAQLFFGGGIVTVKSMTGFMAAVSTTSFGRWAFQGAGTALHLKTRLLADPVAKGQSQYGLSFFSLGNGEAYGLLVGFTALFLAGVVLILSRRKPV